MVLSEQLVGYDVFSFNDPELALEHFTENQSAYALVISDLIMPSLNGLELLKKIKNTNPNVRTIVITAFDFGNQMLQDCMELGIIDLTIGKPVSNQTLRDRIRSELEIYHQKVG
jgi:DNA-binding NtrC family response regulator